MTEINNSLTKEDFINVHWEEVCAASDEKECHSYHTLFASRANEARESGDVITDKIYTLLADVTSMMLQPRSLTEPFAPMVIMRDRRSAIIEDFSEESLNVMSEFVADIKDAEMRSRIADVLWVRKRDFRSAELAIESYLESASILEHPEDWTQCHERIERALRLAISLGKNAGHIDKVVAHIEGLLDKCNGADPLYLSNRLMELLLEHRLGEPVKYSALAENMATEAEGVNDWYRARAHWEVASRWHALAKDTDKSNESMARVAETYVKEAESAVSGDSPRFLAAVTHLQKGVETYRRIGGHNDRADVLHALLLGYQKNIEGEMKSYSAEVDISDHVQKNIARIRGKQLLDAIIEFAKMVMPARVSELRRQVEEMAKKFIGQFLFDQVLVNDEGKVVGRMPSMLSGNPEEVEEAKKHHMFKNAAFHHNYVCSAIIKPLQYQINLEHNVTIGKLMPIVSNNPIVPPGREYIYAQGLQAGMDGDFVLATHLLIPQLENSIRYVLNQRGIITSGLSAEGIQEEFNLNRLLSLEQTKSIFGEDAVFDLRGLLVERWGANLRNRGAHGLMSHPAYYSVDTVYYWGLMLRLCCLPIIIAQSEKAQDKESQE